MSEELFMLYDSTIDTKPFRAAMVAYAHEWGLPVEKGFDITLHGALGAPGRRFLARIENNMVARKVLTAKQADGTLNAKVQSLLIPPVPWADKCVHTALTQIGVHEEPWGSNTGPMIRVYQAACGNAWYEPWCACFRTWSLKENGYDGRFSARAWDWDDIGTRISTGHTHIANAKPNDTVTFQIGDGHVGTYLSHDANYVKTVDGNTSDQVAVRERSLSLIRTITRQGR